MSGGKSCRFMALAIVSAVVAGGAGFEPGAAAEALGEPAMQVVWTFDAGG